MNIKIELPATYAIVSRSVGVECDLSTLSPEIIAKLALHGLTQKVADSAAGAMKGAGFDGRKYGDLNAKEQTAVQDWGKAAMAETLASLVAGNWSERREGSGASPLVSRIRVLIGAMLRGMGPEGVKMWKALKDADDKDAQLDAIYAGQDEAFRADIEAKAKGELEAERAAKAETEKLASGLKFKFSK